MTKKSLVFYFIISPLILFPILNPEPLHEAQEIVSYPSGENTHKEEYRRLEVNLEPITVQDKIIKIASENNFCIETALKIAECESQFGKYLHNWEGSSAKGIYQFTDKTWENYCDGDVLNEEDNIKCFIKLYNDHPNWWACQK